MDLITNAMTVAMMPTTTTPKRITQSTSFSLA
jgi:hypothetical protein